MARRLGVLDRLGLAHLQMSRSAVTLSGGELQRTRLAAQLSTELSDIIFVLDEPGTGLHPADKARLLDIALELRAAGNTVLLRVTGGEGFNWVAVVGQEPIGRTPRSNPATYSKAFDIVRKLFAETDEARGRGINASWFSFNTANGGRCETCTGYGRKLVNMHFLPDVWVVCDACEGRRYTPEALEITYEGLTIDGVLELTVAEAVERLTRPRQLAEALEALDRVGLAFAMRQRRISPPLLELGLFRERTVFASLGTMGIALFVMAGSQFFVAQYLQMVVGLSPLTAGLASLPGSVGGVVGALRPRWYCAGCGPPA